MSFSTHDLAARGKRGLTLSGHAVFESISMPSKGSDPFCHGLLSDSGRFLGLLHHSQDITAHDLVDFRCAVASIQKFLRDHGVG